MLSKNHTTGGFRSASEDARSVDAGRAFLFLALQDDFSFTVFVGGSEYVTAPEIERSLFKSLPCCENSNWLQFLVRMPIGDMHGSGSPKRKNQQ
ncbi:hypothetical protein [Paracoccus sp. PAR01]|uniref:hypothetical protein n=1 Tax=Paracoccus sp. PAR01 TaxID=2769282 RepID=UPI00177C81A6|nr:hypothetical protein [Paracoccus sp. PAR01]MBD9529699.1 hypothetical protein [Paracoccus sp. PAR01]